MYLYNHLVQQLRTRDDAETLWRIYLSLPSRLNLITSRCPLLPSPSSHTHFRPEAYRELIQSLYTFDWLAEKKIVVSFMNLVSLFVSSNPIFLIPSLQMLVKNLVPQTPVSPTHGEGLLLTEEYFLLLRQRQEHIHRTIQNIFRLAPTSTLEIHPILVENFPHKRHTVHLQQEYVTQLLLLCESFPQLQGRIVELIFSKCLELDVDIVIEDSGEAHIAAHEEGDEESNEFFQLDDNPHQDETSSSFRASRRRGGMGEEGAMKIRDDVSETAQKLDCILAIFLSFIRATHHRDQLTGGVGVDSSQSLMGRLFRQMMEAFELRVMTTYKAKYVQFSLFYSCQLAPNLGQSPPPSLPHLFQESSSCSGSRPSFWTHPTTCSLARVPLSISPVSSLVGSSFPSTPHGTSPPSLPPHSPPPAREYLSLLLHWASKYVQQRGQESIPKGLSLQRVDSAVLADYSSYLESATLGAYGRQGHLLNEFGRKVITDYDTLSRHETFFCCVQSMCYAICFLGISMAQIMATSPEEKLHWEVVLNSEFHPLRYAIPTIRTEFLRIAVAGGLIATTTRGGGLAVATGGGANNFSSLSSSSHNPLDTFFPFDPCLLVQVHEQVRDSYRIWETETVLESGVDRGLGSDDEEDEEESESESEDQRESAEGGDEMLSSVASSIASIAFGGDGMNVSLSVGGVGSPSSAYLASRPGPKRGDLRRDLLAHQTPPSNSSSPQRSVTSYDEIAALTGEAGCGLSGEDAWLVMLRAKRARQSSVGSAGSW
jgi:hypothetical protein